MLNAVKITRKGISISMGKKKKKKLKLQELAKVSVAKSNITVLESGELKINKNTKIDLTGYVKKSIDTAMISRLDGIISKEDVVVDEEHANADVLVNMTNDTKCIEMAAKTSDFPQTLVIPVVKKEDLDVFDLLKVTTIGRLLRSSTFASIYVKIKEQWEALNKGDDSNYTNVMYVPNVMVFMNPESGKLMKTPFYTNVLIVAIPSLKYMGDGIQEISQEAAIARVVSDLCDAAIKCRAKRIVTDPFSTLYPMLLKPELVTVIGMTWNDISNTQRFLEQFELVTFAVEDEGRFISFAAARNK